MPNDTTGWPDPSRPGVPVNPERDGWHWLRPFSGPDQPYEWNNGGWNVEDGLNRRYETERVGQSASYLGPCTPPSAQGESVLSPRAILQSWINEEQLVGIELPRAERLRFRACIRELQDALRTRPTPQQPSADVVENLRNAAEQFANYHDVEEDGPLELRALRGAIFEYDVISASISNATSVNMRATFEAWEVKQSQGWKPAKILELAGDVYLATATRMDWIAWQAAWIAALAQLPKSCVVEGAARRICEHAAFARSSEREDDWQPIESAPRDGTRIILFRAGHIVFGKFNDDRHANKPRPYWSHDSERSLGTLDARKTAPTHWRPLPTPPASTGDR